MSANNITHFTLLLLILLVNGYCSAQTISEIGISGQHEYTDTVQTQIEFNDLLNKASHKQEIDAYLKPGIYIVDESQSIYTKFNLKGNSASIKQRNKIFTKADAVKETLTHYICPAENINEFSLFIDDTGNIIPVSEEVDSQSKINFVTSDIISIENDSAQYINHIKIKIPDNLSHLKNRTFEKSFGYIDSWWTAPTFLLSHSDSIYFYCNLSQRRERSQYNAYINGEKFQYNQNISCVIYNIEPKESMLFFDKEYIYIPKKYDRIEIIDSNNKPLFITQDDAEVKFEGINIVNSSSVFQAGKNTSSINLLNCNFHNILKQAFDTRYKSNLKNLNLVGCRFSNCAFLDGIPLINISAPECVGNIANCIFNQYESGFCFYKNTAQNIYIVHCKKFEITRNLFFNAPRGGLFLLNGKIEVVSNEFFNNSIFNSYPYRNFSRDAGAIYCSRLYDDSRIKDDNPNQILLKLNKIHDFYGKGDVRGIFIDDGRGDVTCYGNLIYNGQSYSIDSRVTKTDCYSSIRNKYQFNILAYPYRLTYGDSLVAKDRPIISHNILLFKDKEYKATTPAQTDINISNFEINSKDVKIDDNIWMTLPKDIRELVSPLKIRNRSN